MNLASHAVIIALCSAAVASSVASFSYSWANETDPSYLYALAQPSGDDGAKPYVNCTELDATHRRCEVFLGKFAPGRVAVERICVSDFHATGFLGKIEAVAVAQDRVALAYSYYYTSKLVEFDGQHRYRVLDTASCQAVDAKETFGFSERRYFQDFGSVLLHENGSFDLFKTNHDDACDGATCRYSFDALGHKTEGGAAYLSARYEGTDRTLTPLGRLSRGRYVVLDDYFAYWGRTVRLVLASEGREERQLLKLVLGYSAARDVQHYHGFTAACWTDEFEVGPRSSVYCRQFDASGAKVLDVRFAAVGRVDLVKVQNLPAGGLLVLNNVCGKLRVCKDFQFRYVRNDGYVYQPIKIADVGCRYAFAHQRRMKIWFGEFGNNCAASVCDPGSLTVRNLTTMTGACYPNQYLWSTV